MTKQCGRKKKTQKATGSETMEQYEARIADRCEVGKGCCALRILEADDFKSGISLLVTIIQAAGQEVIFYPKFHCELEYYWAAPNGILEITAHIRLQNSNLQF